MLPVLYSGLASHYGFRTNGYGFVKNCTSCLTTEERHGVYEAELHVLSSDRLINSLYPGNFLKIKANGVDRAQMFEIYQTSRSDIETVVRARHVRYITYNNIIGETITSATARTPQQWWSFITDNDYLEFPIANNGTFTSDILTTGVITAAAESPIRLGDLIQGTKGSMLDVFGGELYFDNFNISLLKRRGRDTGVALRYGSCISSYSQDADSTTMYTHLLPYAYVKAQTADTHAAYHDMPVYHDIVTLGNTLMQYYPRALAYDFSDDMRDQVMNVDSTTGVPTNYADVKAVLETLVSSYITDHRSALTELPVNITIDVEDVLNRLGGCSVCDTVLVYIGSISERVKIVRTQYDALNERYTEIELGTIKKTLADLINGKNFGAA